MFGMYKGWRKLAIPFKKAAIFSFGGELFIYLYFYYRLKVQYSTYIHHMTLQFADVFKR
jgi:hypothetical protein